MQDSVSGAQDAIGVIAKALFTGQAAPASARDDVRSNLEAAGTALASITSYVSALCVCGCHDSGADCCVPQKYCTGPTPRSPRTSTRRPRSSPMRARRVRASSRTASNGARAPCPAAARSVWYGYSCWTGLEWDSWGLHGVGRVGGLSAVDLCGVGRNTPGPLNSCPCCNAPVMPLRCVRNAVCCME